MGRDNRKSDVLYKVVWNNIYNTLRSDTFLIFFYSGVVGVLIDLDHLLLFENKRILHIPITVTVIVICIIAHTYYYRLSDKSNIFSSIDK